MVYLREYPREGRAELSDLLRAWRYPRFVPPEELESAFIVTIWDDPTEQILALGWIIQGPREDSLSLHACRMPGTIFQIGTPRNLEAMALIAEVLGAKRLYAHLPNEARGRIAVDALRRYLAMRGWKQDEHGAYVALGR